MNIEKFSEAVGINSSTVKKYEKDFNIPIPRDPVSGYRVYGQEETDIYLSLKEELKTKTILAIKQELSLRPKPEKVSAPEEKISTEKEEMKSENTEYISPGIIYDISKIDKSVQTLYSEISEMKNFILNQNDSFSSLKEISKTVSELTYKIGQLESQVQYEKQLHHMTIEKYEGEKRLITEYSAGKENKLEQQVSVQVQQLSEKDRKIAELERELAKEKNKSIFQRAFKFKRA